MTKRDLPPIHPGEILLEDFLQPMQISQYHLAQAIGVPPRRINEIVHGKRGITADTALRLGRFFGMEAQFWMNLQTRYDLEIMRKAISDRLDQEVQVHVMWPEKSMRTTLEKILAFVKIEWAPSLRQMAIRLSITLRAVEK